MSKKLKKKLRSQKLKKGKSDHDFLILNLNSTLMVYHGEQGSNTGCNNSKCAAHINAACSNSSCVGSSNFGCIGRNIGCIF